MSNPNQLIGAVKTAKSIHDGDYSSLRDKSFVIRGNMKNNKGRGGHVKKHKSKYTLNQIGDALFTFIKTTNARFDTLTSDVNSLKNDVKGLKQEVKDINARLDYNNLKKLPR